MKELGRQVYLGGYECEEHAAEAYDVAALKCKGCRVRTNFPVSRYAVFLSQHRCHNLSTASGIGVRTEEAAKSCLGVLQVFANDSK